MKKHTPMWVPPEYAGIFWFGVISFVVVGLLTIFVDKTTWVALPISGFAILLGRWPYIKSWWEDVKDFFKSFIV